MICSFACEHTARLFHGDSADRHALMARWLCLLNASRLPDALQTPACLNVGQAAGKGGWRFIEVGKGLVLWFQIHSTLGFGKAAVSLDCVLFLPLGSNPPRRPQRIPASMNKLPPVHPGEIIKAEFLVPLGVSVNAAAKAIGVPTPRLNDVILGKRGISADTALRLERYLGLPAAEWLALQAAYELSAISLEARQEIRAAIRPALG